MTAFTRYMEASHRRSDERAQKLQDAAEAREKERAAREQDAATREDKADTRERLVQRISRNETHWIKWATIVIAVAAVGQVAAASLQAHAAFRSQSPATCICGSPAVPASR
jgi:hypothetical protein